MAENTRKEIHDLGEFGLIDHLTKNFEIKQTSTMFGVGDDAAVIKNGDEMTVISTDMMVCLLYTSPSPRDATLSRMPSSA